jgi:hypothetical protein
LSDRGKKKLQDAMPAWSKAQTKIEAHMKQYIKSPTSKRLIEALESLRIRSSGNGAKAHERVGKTSSLPFVMLIGQQVVTVFGRE